ncbi:MAG: hypothetical protein EXR69_04020 [Myxococcales bacterium]|nr:hypothetical protein [Myxococcales bacterium]
MTEPPGSSARYPVWRPLAASFRIGARQVFAYRAEALVTLFSASLMAALNGLLWTAATEGRDQLAGVPSAELRSYVVMAWVAVSFFATRVNEDIGRRFREGQITADLLRPMSLQFQCYARDLGRAVATLALQTTPMFLMGLFAFGVLLPSHPATWLWWSVSLVLSHCINFGISFLVGLAAFPLQNISGLTHVKGTLVSIFSGALIPLDLYAGALKTFVFCLPFHAMAHTPTSIFLERNVSVASLLAEQAAWALGLWVIGSLSWGRARNALTVQGG